MNAKQRRYFKAILEAERGVARRELQRIAAGAHAEVLAAPGDDSETSATGATDEDDAAVAAHERAALAEIESALELIDAAPERYGVCQVCGAAISLERLTIVPATRVCDHHARGP